jgi:cytochrome c peroxidase
MSGARLFGFGLLVLALGCQPAVRIPGPSQATTPQPNKERPREKLEIVPPELSWQPAQPGQGNDTIPLLFVSEAKDPRRWATLKQFWNPMPLDLAGVAALVRPDPLAVGALLVAAGPQRVEIKVPLGLPDPTPFIPPEDPPTLGKWQLGQRLFYDPEILTPTKNLSCASCHDPRTRFASHNPLDGDSLFHTPSLLNVVYKPRIFWDGRGELLEVCVQRTLEDEREPTAMPGRHVWGGVVRRVLENPNYRRDFAQVFGIPHPTQDSVSRALATYLRTLLGGNSLHDRAVAAARAAGKKDPDPAHYAAVLRPEDLKDLERPGIANATVGAELHEGYELFYDKRVQSLTACVACHGGPLFTDHGYHNLGLDPHSNPVVSPGRFATLPPGQRSAAAMGAYSTPSLRDVARTAPYFHDGSRDTLARAVWYHLDGTRWTSFTDPLFVSPGTRVPLPRRLTEKEAGSLLLFLRALNGEEIPPILLPAPR